jgi:hypothetical protein
MGFIRWIDRHLWSLPLLVFLLVELAFGVWSSVSRMPVLLAGASLSARQTVYSSLTGSAGTLLGLALAVVAVLIAFAPRVEQAGRATKGEKQAARARTIIVGSLLMSSFFMLIVVITSTIALSVDTKHLGNSAITTLIEASGIASVVGILVGGIGLALVVADRSR